MELKLENGIYVGDVKDGKANGNGVIVFDNGDKYEGQFIDNVATGTGKCMYANGSTYEGDVKNFLPDGKGIFIYNDKKYYEGEFLEGKFSGKGKYFNGSINYEGVFSNNEIVIDPDNITKDLENIGLNLCCKGASIYIDSYKKEFLVYIRKEKYRIKYEDFIEKLNEVLHIIDGKSEGKEKWTYNTHKIWSYLPFFSKVYLVASIILAIFYRILSPLDIVSNIFMVLGAIFVYFVCQFITDVDKGVKYNYDRVEKYEDQIRVLTEKCEKLESDLNKIKNQEKE